MSPTISWLFTFIVTSALLSSDYAKAQECEPLWADNVLAAPGLVYSITAIPGGLVVSCNCRDPWDRLMKWDGGAWTSIGYPFNYPVGAMSYFQGNLVIGSTLSEPAFALYGNVAEWDGGTIWSPLDSGVDANVYAMVQFDELLVVGGYFDFAGEVEARGVAAWNGENWTSIGTGFDGFLHALTADGNKLFAAGHLEIGGVEMNNAVGQWDGIAWSFLGDSMTNYVSSLVIFQEQLIAAGPFGIAKWNGAHWESLETQDLGVIRTQVVYDELLVVGGGLNSTGVIAGSGVATWDGSSWSPLGDGVDGDVFALEVINDGLGPGSALYVGGTFDQAGEAVSMNLARWGCLYDPADLDHDGDVDLSDFNSFIPCFQGPEVATSELCLPAEFSDSGHVDLRDVAFFENVFTSSP